MKNLVKVFIGMVIIIVLVIAGIWGKNYMDKRALEKDYQQGMELIQSYVTDYLVNNYEGIERIEWQGIGVEWRNSPIYGPSIMGNYVNSDVKVFVSKDSYFTMSYSLTDYADYDYDAKKYKLLGTISYDRIDNVNLEIENTIYKYDEMLNITGLKVSEAEKIDFEKIKKSDSGSPDTEVHYNLEIHELKY